VEATGLFVAVDREARRAIGTRPSLGGAQRLCREAMRGDDVQPAGETDMAKKKAATKKPARDTKRAQRETKPAKRETPAKKAPAAKSAGKLSALDAAAKVLAEAGAALTTKDMVERMSAAGYWSSPGGKTSHATLYSAILREIQTKGGESRFAKTERGKFTLA
jgi:hypothetical protein